LRDWPTSATARDHNDSKAKPNFGDCFAYALARERNEPLLFVGNDFIHTDITPALAQ